MMEWFKIYFEIAVLITALALPLSLLSRYASRLGFGNTRALAHFLLIATLALPFAMRLLPQESLLEPSVQVFSESGTRTTPSIAMSSSRNALPKNTELFSIPAALGQTPRIVLALLLASLLAFLVRIARLELHLRALPVLRSPGRVRLCVGESAYSGWSFGRKFIVMPASLLTNRRELLLAFAHEARHHRAGDTLWAIALDALKTLYVWNPAAYLIQGRIGELHEFACDEFLIGRRKLSPQAYGRCLVQAAEQLLASKRFAVPSGTTGMATHSRGLTLRRRVEMLFNHETNVSRPAPWVTIAATLSVVISLLAGISYASVNVVHDRRVTMEQAQKYAEVASKDSQIPITVNDLVLKRLNRFLGTPDGRVRLKSGFSRMPQYRKMIEAKAKELGLPPELAFVPLFESNYRNDAVSSLKAKGLWQFIGSTAKTYDLVVNESKDEREDPEKSTVAAMRYLKHLHGLFGDWRLALKSYNEGESRVLAQIKKLGTSDPWELEAAHSTEGYLSGAMAMLIIYKNPQLVE